MINETHTTEPGRWVLGKVIRSRDLRPALLVELLCKVHHLKCRVHRFEYKIHHLFTHRQRSINAPLRLQDIFHNLVAPKSSIFQWNDLHILLQNLHLCI